MLTKRNLTEAVLSQIPKEVDWGVLISGGVDSSILASICKDTNNDLLTFSICSSGVETEDLRNAREVAKELETNHFEIRVDPSDIVEQYKDYVLSVEDINRRFVFYYFLSMELRKHVKVALCGEGADELYAGYPLYRNIEKYVNEVKEGIKKFDEHLTQRMKAIVLERLSQMDNLDFKSIYDFEIQTQLPVFQLNPVDKCSMRFGVELRVPYLSLPHALQVMEYSEDILCSGPIEKHLLRSAFTYTGLSTIHRPKVFAGTRTLPEFYDSLSSWANNESRNLKSKYQQFANVLDDLDLLTLDILVTELNKLRLSRKKMLSGTQNIKNTYA